MATAEAVGIATEIQTGIIHGDALDVLRGLPDACVDAIVTDPPYGMSYQSARRTDTTARHPKIANDERPFVWWLHDAYRIVKTGGALLSFSDWKHQEMFRSAIECAGFTVRSHVIWDRDWHGLGDVAATFAPQHDVIWFATKGRFIFPNGRPKSVFRVQRLAANVLTHPAEKPVELMRQLVRAVCGASGVVLDPFAGSGSTGVAAVAEGMRFIGVEREAEYVAIARARIGLALASKE